MSSLELLPPQEAKLNAVMDAALREFPKRYRPNSCIAATRVLLNVFEGLHVRARAVPVYVEVANPKLVELINRHGRRYEDTAEAERWRDLGAWQVTIGHPGDEAKPGFWAGHLAAVAWESVLVDLTLPQATRPHKGISLAPVAVRVSPDWLAGGLDRSFEMNGSQVAYVARPSERGHMAAKDWIRPDRHAGAVEAILRRVRNRLALAETATAPRRKWPC